MKSNWIYGALLASALTVPSVAQVGIYIGRQPPALRYEARGPEPGPGYAWVDGYWSPHGNRYTWVSGRWDRPPYEGAVWSHPHYDHQRRGWELHEGHWDHDDRHHGHDHDHDHH
jgi:hypothetical protein